MEVDEDPTKLQPPSSVANNTGCPTTSFPHLVRNLQQPMLPSTTTVGAKTSTSTAMNAAEAAGISVESSHQTTTTSPRPIATTAAATNATTGAITGADERAADAGEEAGFKTAATTSTRKESPPTTTTAATTLLLTSTKFRTQNTSSRGDWPHERRASNMTISHLVEGSPRASSSNSGDMDALVVDMDTSEPPRRISEDSDEGPINLSRCNIRNSVTVPSSGNSPMGMMSAKMRLKQKQRLEAVAKAASEMQRTIVPPPTSETNFYETPTSALHRLANVAAERKQVSVVMTSGNFLCLLPRGGGLGSRSLEEGKASSNNVSSNF